MDKQRNYKRIIALLLIIITLLIGFIIGFLVNGYLTGREHREFMKMGTPPGFKEIIYHEIRPSAEQKKSIEPIIDKYSFRFYSIFMETHKDMKVLQDSLRVELKPFLTQEQINRMSRMRRGPFNGGFREGFEPPFMKDRMPPPPEWGEPDKKQE